MVSLAGISVFIDGVLLHERNGYGMIEAPSATRTGSEMINNVSQVFLRRQAVGKMALIIEDSRILSPSNRSGFSTLGQGNTIPAQPRPAVPFTQATQRFRYFVAS